VAQRALGATEREEWPALWQDVIDDAASEDKLWQKAKSTLQMLRAKIAH
jgi:hypothetical protein